MEQSDDDDLLNVIFDVFSDSAANDEAALQTTPTVNNASLQPTSTVGTDFQPFSSLPSDPETIPIPAILGAEWIRLGGYGSEDDGDGDGDDDGEDDLEDRKLTVSLDTSTGKKKRRRSVGGRHPDVERIAMATAENLRSMNIDPNSKEGMKQKRRIRNRMSAQLHRERKKAYISYLETVVRSREAWIIRLKLDNDRLLAENASLRGSLPPRGGLFGYNHNYFNLSSFDARASSSAVTVDDQSTIGNSSPAHTSSDSEGSLHEPSYSSRAKSFAGKGLSLFSLLCFLFVGMTQRNGEFNPWAAMNEHSGASSLSLGQDNVDLLPWSESQISLIANSNRRLSASENALVVLPNLATRDTSFLPSSLPAPVALPDSKGNTPLSLVRPVIIPSSEGSIDISSTQALWEYHHHVLELFPTSAPVRNNRKVLQKRNLRHGSVEQVSGQNNYSFTTERGERHSSVREEKSMSPVYSYLHPGGGEGRALSRVLMTEGKALLDSGMTLNFGRFNRMDEGSSSGSSASDMLGKAQSSSSVMTTAISTEVVSARPAESLLPPVPVSASGFSPDKNVILMLMPASAIRWGKSWTDGDARTLKTLFREQNISDSNSGPLGSLDDEPDLSDMWVELECQVFRAQVVRNVSFS